MNELDRMLPPLVLSEGDGGKCVLILGMFGKNFQYNYLDQEFLLQEF